MITLDKKSEIQKILESMVRIPDDQYPVTNTVIIDYKNELICNFATKLKLGQHIILTREKSYNENSGEHRREGFMQFLINSSLEDNFRIFSKDCINEKNIYKLIQSMIEQWAIRNIDRSSKYFDDSKRYSNIDVKPGVDRDNSLFYSYIDIDDELFVNKFIKLVNKNKSYIYLSDDIQYLFNSKILEAAVYDIFSDFNKVNKQKVLDKINFDRYTDNDDYLLDYDRAKELFNLN